MNKWYYLLTIENLPRGFSLTKSCWSTGSLCVIDYTGNLTRLSCLRRIRVRYRLDGVNWCNVLEIKGPEFVDS